LANNSPTNPGDSGGPLVNDKGELVGVTQGGGPTARGRPAGRRTNTERPPARPRRADRCPDSPTSFYRAGRGLSWAFVWPVEYLTLRLEGGSHSEFGSYAIAGAQWNHPSLPLALGIGVPVHMKHADGLIGAIFQIRAKLN
jgi:hypothetical protein